MKALTHDVNAVLRPMFANAGIDLVDYKLEFGHPVAEPGAPLMLGDEFTPDGCRLWDAKTGEKLDKDRFRRDLGSVIEHYREVARRIGAPRNEPAARRGKSRPRPAFLNDVRHYFGAASLAAWPQVRQRAGCRCRAGAGAGVAVGAGAGAACADSRTGRLVTACRQRERDGSGKDQ
jgi:hypothetical protein